MLNRSTNNHTHYVGDLERNYTNIGTSAIPDGTIVWSDAVNSQYASLTSNMWATTTSLVSNIDSLQDWIPEVLSIFNNDFAKKTRKLDNDSFMVLLESLREDDREEYLGALGNVITHPDFRKLSDDMLTEMIKDLDELADRGINVEEHYNLDGYDSYKVLKKLR